MAVCDVDLRMALDAATEEALELADELASLVATSPGGAERIKTARVAANYLQARAMVRRLRRVLAVEVAG
jgi:RNA-splicing ligase RtcB